MVSNLVENFSILFKDKCDGEILFILKQGTYKSCYGDPLYNVINHIVHCKGKCGIDLCKKAIIILKHYSNCEKDNCKVCRVTKSIKEDENELRQKIIEHIYKLDIEDLEKVYSSLPEYNHLQDILLKQSKKRKFDEI